jgi:hypothetical protein
MFSCAPKLLPKRWTPQRQTFRHHFPSTRGDGMKTERQKMLDGELYDPLTIE